MGLSRGGALACSVLAALATACGSFKAGDAPDASTDGPAGTGASSIDASRPDGSGGAGGTGGSHGGADAAGGRDTTADGSSGAGGAAKDAGTDGASAGAGGTIDASSADARDANDVGDRVDASGADAPNSEAGVRDASVITDANDATTGVCYRARLLWYEDFETGDYSRWTSKTYNNDWGDGCQNNNFSTNQFRSPSHSHRSEIICNYNVNNENVHRGFGGLQFSGDTVVPDFTNQGVGIDAPFGIVNTFHSWLETPTVFDNFKWFSFWTANSDCNWADEVLTVGLEDPSNKLAAAHYMTGGGTRTFAANAPAFTMGHWSRITIYVNYYAGAMHIWQDGQEVSHVTFVRPKKTICQLHWGAFASGDNDNILLYEDDNSLWKLDEPWTNFAIEPWFGGQVQACGSGG